MQPGQARQPQPAQVPGQGARQPGTMSQPQIVQRRREGDPRQQQAQRAYLAAHGVEKSFGGRMVVKGVTLYVRRGEVVGLLGPNGAGKTTTFYMTVGLTAPTPAAFCSTVTTSPATRCTSGRARASAICRRSRRSSAASPSRQNILAILESAPDRGRRGAPACRSCWPSSA